MYHLFSATGVITRFYNENPEFSYILNIFGHYLWWQIGNKHFTDLAKLATAEENE